MPEEKPIMAQENFAKDYGEEKGIKADFSTDEGALEYANGLLDEFVAAMRYSLEKHIAGWPGDDRELNTHEALRHVFRNLSLAHAGYMEADYENPAFTKLNATSRVEFQLPSCDCSYHTALLHGNYRYRLTGNRGSAQILQLAVYQGHACDLIGWKCISLANNIDNPQLAPDENIDIILSREKPDDLGDAVWMELPDGPCELHSRQYYGDWESENPADFRLVMESQTFPAKLLDSKTAETRFRRIPNFLRVHTDFYRAGVQTHLDADPREIEEYVIPGAFEGTKYFNGHFRCRPDQAVIMEIDEPPAPYWNMELSNLMWEPPDWWARLISYNFAQVHQDTDRKIRFVASWTDPGVPNWLDCSGRTLHLVNFRFFRPTAQPSSPRLKTVNLAELEAHMPSDTPKVVPEERRDLMKRRLASVYRRRIGDF